LEGGVDDSLDLERDGAIRVRQALDDAALGSLEALLAAAPRDRAGVRLYGVAGLHRLLAPGGHVGRIAAGVQGPTSRAVRAVLFDKTASRNWRLGWRQDRTIVVKARVETDEFGPWSRKGGLQHVAPPFELLRRMLTLRVHLDDVDENNAPLLVALGSHRLGPVAVEGIDSAVAASRRYACLASAGDVWVYLTPILHASDAARTARRRRVLQVDYADAPLPGALEWLGV
jgi:hypothetical protein